MVRFECSDCGNLVYDVDTIMLFSITQDCHGSNGAETFTPIPLCGNCYNKRTEKKEK
jgi:hypothetical protein